MKLVYDGIDKNLKVFGDHGELAGMFPARNDSVASNAWRSWAGCPPGSYLISAPESNDPAQESTEGNNWEGEGLWFIPIYGIPDHTAIGIHGGGSCVEDPLALKQGWCPTENCIRLQNEDLQNLISLLHGRKYPIPIQVVQDAAE